MALLDQAVPQHRVSVVEAAVLHEGVEHGRDRAWQPEVVPVQPSGLECVAGIGFCITERSRTVRAARSQASRCR